MIQINYGHACVTLDPVISGTTGDGKTVENYDDRDLAAAVGAILRSLKRTPENFYDLLLDDLNPPEQPPPAASGA